MSLIEPAAGILQTHVTWEDVEGRLQKALNTNATLGAKKSVSIVGEGNGFFSRIGLITCDWKDVEADTNLPEKFALKMATCMAAKAMLEANPNPIEPAIMQAILDHFVAFIKDTHNAECRVYEFLRPFIDRVAVPRCFFVAPFSKENELSASIALEYCDDARISHIYETLSVAQVREVARELGKLQALSILNGVEREKWLGDRDVYSSFWKNYTADVLLEMFSPLKQLDATLNECVDAVCELIPAYYGTNLPVTLHKQYGVRPVLVNGDLWSANVLLDANSGTLRALIDWQMAHHGTGVEDLLRLAFSALSSGDRRAHMPELLHELHDSLLQTLDGAPAPYTEEQMLELYEILLPHAGFFLATTIMPLFRATILVATVSEEEKEQRKIVLLGKVRGVCEDIVSYHDKNKGGRQFVWKPANWTPRESMLPGETGEMH